MTPNENAKACGLRIICVVFLQNSNFQCVYRVYTSDGGFLDYVGYDNVPEFVKSWLSERNSLEYIVSGCMFVSGCKVV